MTEIQGFRLMLVLVAAIAFGAGGGWGWLHAHERAAETAVDNAFGDYNRYIAACGDGQDSAAWDLARRSYDQLAQASSARDRYADQAEVTMWAGAAAAAVVVAGFYALRWAMTGKVRPLWVLRKGPQGRGSDA